MKKPSEELSIRKEWEKRDRVYKAAMKWSRAWDYAYGRVSTKADVGLSKANQELLKACAKARKHG